MRITCHAAVGTVCAIPLMKWSYHGAGLFLLASILIDVDHLLFYIVQTKKIPRHMLNSYRTWEYYGPRIHLFHNYETALCFVLIGMMYGGFFAFIGAGVLFHLACDQVDTYRLFKYFRVRTLIGDILRYGNYLRAKKGSTIDDYMLSRRNTWWIHLQRRLPPHKLEYARKSCSILNLYPTVPIDEVSGDSGEWSKLL